MVVLGGLALVLYGAVFRPVRSDARDTNGQSLQSAKMSGDAAARVEVDRRALIGEPIGKARAQMRSVYSA